MAYSKSIIGIITFGSETTFESRNAILYWFHPVLPRIHMLYVSEVLMVPPTKVAIPIASIISSLVTPIL
jgi:hypothetical protein